MSDRQEHVLPAIYVGAQPPPGKDPIGGGFDRTSKPGFQPAVGINLHKLKTTASTLAEEYKTLSNQLPQTIENELAATRLEGPTNPLPPAEAIIRELGVRNKLLIRKTAEFHYKTAIANEFYGFDPIDRPLQEFYPKALTLEKVVVPDGIAMQAWATSYRAAHDARLLSQTIQLLNQQSVNVQNFLRAVQADDQARMAAEQEAQRVAAELARINAQAEARAREQARVAALAEAQRLANEQAEAAAKAAAQHIAAEQARLEALAEVKRQAERVRLEAEQQAKKLAEEHARQRAITFANAGSSAAFGPVFTISSGTISTNPTISLALKAALRTAVSAVTAGATASAGAIVGGFAALLIPSKLGNSDLYSISVPLSELASDSTADLHEVAVARGEIELPVIIGSRTFGGKVEVVVAATDGLTVPSKVSARLATFDSHKNIYTSYSPDSPSRVMTWTPIVKPENASTAFPATKPDVPVYEGATVTPTEGRVDTFPSADQYSFGGFITVFPIESGLPPVFTMFSDRRQDPGVASGSGQPVSDTWLGAATQGEGAPIPSQIADQLRGKNFRRFRDFREALWIAVAQDTELSKQFISNNILEMKNGRAPFSRKSDRVGDQVKFELHHIQHLSKDGTLYDIDNIHIVTPKRHGEIHKGEK